MYYIADFMLIMQEIRAVSRNSQAGRFYLEVVLDIPQKSVILGQR